MAMTAFEKALLGELKSIRKELQKMNQNGPFDIKIEPPTIQPPTANDILAEKLAELKKSQQKEKQEELFYNPLSRG